MNKREDIVSVEISKQLYECGWDLPTRCHYYNDNGTFKLSEFTGWDNKHRDPDSGNRPEEIYGSLPVPTLEQVIDWFEKHQLWIETDMEVCESGEYDGCIVFRYTIKTTTDYKTDLLVGSSDEIFPTRYSAKLAGIEYAIDTYRRWKGLS